MYGNNNIYFTGYDTNRQRFSLILYIYNIGIQQNAQNIMCYYV